MDSLNKRRKSAPALTASNPSKLTKYNLLKVLGKGMHAYLGQGGSIHSHGNDYNFLNQIFFENFTLPPRLKLFHKKNIILSINN